MEKRDTLPHPSSVRSKTASLQFLVPVPLDLDHSSLHTLGQLSLVPISSRWREVGCSFCSLCLPTLAFQAPFSTLVKRGT
jgi:hypothetical protein